MTADLLAIFAHPDDAEFGAGGTLARWARAGCAVTILVLTDGSKGSWDAETSTSDLMASRRGEQSRAAAVLVWMGLWSPVRSAKRFTSSWVMVREVRVNFGIMLAVVTDERPRQVWEVCCQPCQRIDFMGHTGPKPPVFSRAPGGQ